MQHAEQRRRGRAQRLDACPSVAVSEAHARESEMAYGVAREKREPVAVLRVVLHGVRIQLHLVAHRQRILPGLIEVVTARKDCEAGADRPVKQVGFREAE